MDFKAKLVFHTVFWQMATDLSQTSIRMILGSNVSLEAAPKPNKL